MQIAEIRSQKSAPPPAGAGLNDDETYPLGIERPQISRYKKQTRNDSSQSPFFSGVILPLSQHGSGLLFKH